MAEDMRKIIERELAAESQAVDQAIVDQQNEERLKSQRASNISSKILEISGTVRQYAVEAAEFLSSKGVTPSPRTVMETQYTMLGFRTKKIQTTKARTFWPIVRTYRTVTVPYRSYGDVMYREEHENIAHIGLHTDGELVVLGEHNTVHRASDEALIPPAGLARYGIDKSGLPLEGADALYDGNHYVSAYEKLFGRLVVDLMNGIEGTSMTIENGHAYVGGTGYHPNGTVVMVDKRSPN